MSVNSSDNSKEKSPKEQGKAPGQVTPASNHAAAAKLREDLQSILGQTPGPKLTR